MADYDITYTQESLIIANEDFDYTGSRNGDHDCTIGNVSGRWNWTDAGTISDNTGPPSGQAGTYLEGSSTAVGDTGTATLKTANQANGSLYKLFFTVDVCMYGVAPIVVGTFKIEAYAGDSQWNLIDEFDGNSVEAFVSRGPYDCSSYENADFKVRFTTTQGNDFYTNDFAFRNLRIYGDARQTYSLAGVTRDENGDALGSCDVYLLKNNGDNTMSFIDYCSSNVTTGSFSFTEVPENSDLQVIAFLDGAINRMDCTEWTLTGTEE